MTPIPICAAKFIAEGYGYDQVIIYARKVGDPDNGWKGGCEHMTTYGVDRAKCDAAAKIGDFLKYKIMGWKPDDNSANRVIAELMDRRLLDDVADDLHEEIALSLIEAVRG